MLLAFKNNSSRKSILSKIWRKQSFQSHSEFPSRDFLVLYSNSSEFLNITLAASHNQFLVSIGTTAVEKGTPYSPSSSFPFDSFASQVKWLDVVNNISSAIASQRTLRTWFPSCLLFSLYWVKSFFFNQNIQTPLLHSSQIYFLKSKKLINQPINKQTILSRYF